MLPLMKLDTIYCSPSP